MPGLRAGAQVQNARGIQPAPPGDVAPLQPGSGGRVERLIFEHRLWVLIACALITLVLAGQLPRLSLGTSFEEMLPAGHPYVRNYLEQRAQLRGLGDAVRIVVENRDGDIYESGYIAALQRVHDEVFLLPGVDRAWMKSLWAPVVRWTEVTEEGFAGGPVMPLDYDGSSRAVDALRLNIHRAGLVGSLVANDQRSSAIVAPLLPRDADGRSLDYARLASMLEGLRQAHQSAPGGPALRLSIVGAAKLAGDMEAGLHEVVRYFIVSAAIVATLLFWFTRCWRSTGAVLACSMLAVVWQLGLLAALGWALNPYSVLVPFLVFAIGVSHGTQKMNGIMQDIGRGATRVAAARRTFRRLFLVGFAALAADAAGFAVLALIDIPAIRALALSASLGVGVLIVTNLVLLPVLLSYVGVSATAAARPGSRAMGRLLARTAALAMPPRAGMAVLVAAMIGIGAFLVGREVQVGDTGAGAPELRADSRYNQDLARIASEYGISSDVFVVMLKTPREQCGTYENLTEADRLGWTLSQLPGVQKVESLADTVRIYTAGAFEGNPKWLTVSGDQRIIDAQVGNALSWNSNLLTADCSLLPVIAYLSDHRAATLSNVVDAAERFGRSHASSERAVLLAAGSAGMEAATNIVVRQAHRTMLVCVYAAVGLLCFIAFRSWRAVVIALVPLVLTTLAAEALMALMGIGLKVATLPVVALGVGIGVDYTLYLLGVQLASQRRGASMAEAVREAASFTGTVVVLVGFTLAAGVATWAFSPIKFQADMGILLAFMFLWNMVAALTLVPALSRFLLRDPGLMTARARPH
jgi:predicted RND superfamily exporter protein